MPHFLKVRNIFHIQNIALMIRDEQNIPLVIAPVGILAVPLPVDGNFFFFAIIIQVSPDKKRYIVSAEIFFKVITCFFVDGAGWMPGIYQANCNGQDKK